MNSRLTGRTASLAGAVLALGLALPGLKAYAQQTLCAIVKLELNQKATLEREAFDAHLEVDNNLPTRPLTNFKVQIFVKDANGNPADSSFFIKISSLTGTSGVDGTGVVQSSSTADIHWLIIPSSGTGGANPAGQRYAVSAMISAVSDGVPQSLTTFDAFITVHPQPLVKLEYALPYEVFGDEPLTESIEPIEPFPLAARVTNVGYGTAANFQIQSAQPRITDNKQGLAVDFKLIGTKVAGQTIPDTLLIPFGDVAPGAVSQASWIMSATLSGRFISFNSTFTHAAELGGQLTSLMQSVNTYTLLHDGLVDLPGRDQNPDYLVNETMDREAMQTLLDSGAQPAAEYLLESDQPNPLPVTEIPGALSGTLGGASASLTLTFTAGVSSNVWAHSYAPFSYGKTVTLTSARRGDGKVINPANVWISKHFRKSDRQTVYWINILDLTSSTNTYTFQFDPSGLDAAPGAVIDLAALTASSGGALGLTWSSPGEDGYTGYLFGGHFFFDAETNPAAAFSPASSQVNFATSAAPGSPQSFAVSNLIGNTTYYVALFTQDTGGSMSGLSNLATAYTLPNAPTGLAVSSLSASSFAAAWQIGNNSLPIAYSARLSAELGGPILSSSPFQESFNSSFTFTNLLPNTTYFVAGLAQNPETGVTSPLSLLGSAVTYAVPPSSLPFTDVTSGSAVAHWSLGENPPDTEFLAELSTSPSHEPVFTASGWVRAPSFAFTGLATATTYYGQVKARNRANIETAYTDLGVLRTVTSDFLPPRTSLLTGTPSLGAAPVYVTSLTTFTFSAVDDFLTLYDSSGTVAQSLLSIDSAPFTAVLGTFSVAGEGLHFLSYYSLDQAGNTEAAKGLNIAVDNTGPATILHVSGSTTSDAEGRLVTGPDAVFELAAEDPVSSGAASGLAVTRYLIDQDPAACPEQGCTILTFQEPFTLSAGTHTIYYYSQDKLGNEEAAKHTYATVSTAPVGIAVRPSTGPIGIPFSIAGSGFGAYNGANTRVKFGSTAAPISVWNDTTISGSVPGLSSGSYAVAIERQTGSTVAVTSAGYFLALIPSVSTVTPSAAPLAAPFTVSGAHFGSYNGALTRLLLGGATVAISVWTDAKISGTVPGAAGPGLQPFIVERRTADGGLMESATIYFSVALPSATDLNPSTGPIGIPFAIAGSDFGPYNGAYTRVLFNGTTAPISVWNDSAIQGTVPGLSSGSYAVTVERLSTDGGKVQAQAGIFEVTVPAMASLSPSSGPIGVPFAIAGASFGPYNGTNTTVRVGPAIAAISVWNDNEIKGTIPGGLAVGDHAVMVERVTSDGGLSRSAAFQFEVTAPSITAISPSSGPIGMAFTLTGASFGPYNGANTEVLFGTVTAAVSLWDDTLIKGTVPGALGPGPYAVKVRRKSADGGLVESGAVDFQVAGLYLASISPSSGPIGMPFTIAGAEFDSYGGANTRVLFNGTTAAISSWNNTTIQGTIPALATGTFDVTVERENGGVVSRSNSVAFEVVALQASGIAPSSGPIGVPFAISGTGFGPYNGTNTTVRVGPAIAAISVWNDKTIQGTIPGISTGMALVLIERAVPGGLTSSATLYFEVTVPEVFSISPSSGPIGMAFTLAGASFGPYNGANTEVFFGTVTAALSLWNNAMISGTVPGLLGPGPYPVKVRRQSPDGKSIESAPVIFEVAGLSLASIDPSSGPIGAPFTIAGTGFDSYGGANTRVLFNGATVAISVWNDTTIQGTVPGLQPGLCGVTVERENGGAVSRSNSAAFTIVAPQAAGIAPSSGPIGVPFSIAGTGFGPYNGANTRVLVGGATAPISVWNDTEIKGTMPGALAAGNHAVMVERVGSDGGLSRSATFQFEVTAPEVFSLSPASGPIGMPFSITGRSFGPYNGAFTRVLLGGTSAPISLWNDNEIKGTIPGGLAVGNHAVVVERASSDGGKVSSSAGEFQLTVPAISEVTPSSAPIGAPFTIHGESFGPYNGANTQVLIGGATAPLSVWNDTLIQGTVPGVVPGIYDLKVLRQTGSMQSQSNVVSFSVLLPQAGGISPSSGPIGVPFTINGSGFGPYNGTNTTVRVGPAIAAISVWNDTAIKGTIPGGLAVGNHAVLVERASSDGGKVSSSAGEFQVTVPAISVVTPSSAPVGNAFTITGTSFGPYNGANTRVLIGGTTAPLSLWNDTTITGRIPYLAAGAQTIVVERATSDGGLIVSNEASITVVVPQISSMAPASGGTGIAFLLTGSGFGTYNGANTKVMFGDLSASLSSWSDTQIRGIVPDDLAVGIHAVAIELTASGGMVRSNETSYEVTGDLAPQGLTLTLMSADAALPISPESGGKVEAPNRSSVDVPPAAVEKEITITLSRPTEKEDEREEARRNLPIAKVGEPVEFGPEGTRFSQHVTIELPFDPDMVPVGKTASDLALHYWNKEQKTWEALNTEVDLVRRKLKARTDHFSLYQPMVVGVQPEALAPADFGFRDVYAFPNPARSRNPTIRVQVGQADSVDVHIYDVSGRLVNSANLVSGQILDDGNGKGPQWTYDYNWDVSGVGSGVYLYAVTAKKAGCSPIRKTAKVGVIK